MTTGRSFSAQLDDHPKVKNAGISIQEPTHRQPPTFQLDKSKVSSQVNKRQGKRKVGEAEDASAPT